jgi:acetyltransferase-like isoleucine patch superfamily enzyme
MSINKIREFANVNNWYLLAEEIWSRPLSLVRNRVLSSHLHTNKFRVGRNSYIRGITYMKIGSDFHAGDCLWLEAISRYQKQVFNPRIVIGEGVRASHSVHIAATNYVEIGDGCLFGSKVIITDHGHGQYQREHSSPLEPPTLRPLDSDRKVIIGRNVWLGDGVVVMPDVVIGEGCVIGANSVVTKCIAPFTMAVGAPAIPIKQYDFSRKEWGRV